MGKLEDILRSNHKPKEILDKLVDAVCHGRIKDKEFLAFFRSSTDVDKGICADVMKHVSEQRPEILAPYIEILTDHVNYEAPRVKWGAAEAIGNLAEKYPDKVILAVPGLLKNTVENKVNTTVVRWCAAYGLSEIVKHSKKAQKKLVPKIKEIVRKEKNNGVRNVYLRALKQIEK